MTTETRARAIAEIAEAIAWSIHYHINDEDRDALGREIEAALTAIAAPASTAGWQPTSVPPEIDRRVLVAAGTLVAEGRLYKGGKWGLDHDYDDAITVWPPTHWMPLPAPPLPSDPPAEKDQ